MDDSTWITLSVWAVPLSLLFCWLDNRRFVLNVVIHVKVLDAESGYEYEEAKRAICPADYEVLSRTADYELSI